MSSITHFAASTLQTVGILIGLGLISLLLFGVVAYSVVRFWIVGSGRTLDERVTDARIGPRQVMA